MRITPCSDEKYFHGGSITLEIIQVFFKLFLAFFLRKVTYFITYRRTTRRQHTHTWFVANRGRIYFNQIQKQNIQNI